MFGKNSSEVEVSHISVHGFCLCLKHKEYFLNYREFRWLKEATVKEILNVHMLHGHHLHWRELDVDLEIDALNNPQNYPLKYK